MYSSQRFKDGILNEEEKFTNESTPVLHGKRETPSILKRFTPKTTVPSHNVYTCAPYNAILD